MLLSKQLVLEVQIYKRSHVSHSYKMFKTTSFHFVGGTSSFEVGLPQELSIFWGPLCLWFCIRDRVFPSLISLFLCVEIFLVVLPPQKKRFFFCVVVVLLNCCKNKSYLPSCHSPSLTLF